MDNAKAGQGKLERPLEGIRIVEYGVFHAGPGGNAILGDLGTDVIKIENQAGDPERYWTTVAEFDLALNNEESIIFEASNRNQNGRAAARGAHGIGPQTIGLPSAGNRAI